MTRKLRKAALLAVKLVIMAVLLTWVISQVHWHDYVTADGDKKSCAVVGRGDRPGELRVRTGMLWWARDSVRPESDFDPIPQVVGGASDGRPQVVRKGFASAIRGIRTPLLPLAVGGFLASLLVIAVRWWFLLRIQDIRIRLWEAVRLTFLGQFFNYVVPGTVGGDLVKAYYVSRHTPKTAAVLVSIFVDRVLGLTELTLVGAVMVAVVCLGHPENFGRIRQPAIALTVVVALVAAAFAFLLSAGLRKALHVQRLYQRLPIAHHIAAAGDAALLYRQRLGSLIRAVAMTFGAHVLWIGSIAMIGLSLGLATAWYNFFLYIPLIYIIGAVPLTPGGVGLIEVLYVKFFGLAGVTDASAVLALALLARLVPMIWAIPGIFVALTGPRLPKAAQMQAELEAAENAEAPAMPR